MHTERVITVENQEARKGMKMVQLFLRFLLALAVIATITAPAAAQNAVPILINYQGELKSPTTGDPVRDGDYDMVFEIFSDATRGVSLWRGKHTAANRNPVEVRDGIFNVILGSGEGNALDPSVFKKPDAWLEMTIGRETLAPRQRITSVAYSMVSDNSRLLDGKSASEFLTPSQGDTLYLSLTDNDSFAAGQGAQADHHGAFVWADSTGDPLASTADDEFRVRATGGVNFDVGDNAFRVAGDFEVGGDLQADRLVYSSPRTHYYVVGGEDFKAVLSQYTHVSPSAQGGAYILGPGDADMVAPVHLPHGATLVELKVFFCDESTSDLDVKLKSKSLDSGLYSTTLAEVTSSGVSGYDSKSDTVSSSQYKVVDNTSRSLHILAWCTDWDGHNLRIMGAVITYEIEEAL